MLIENLVAPFFATNCWIIATEKSEECIIIDPGIAIPDLTHEIGEVLSRFRLKPVAALLTHGHLDHTFSVVPLSRSSSSSDLVAYIHSEDRILLTEPERAMSIESRQLIATLQAESGRTQFTEPSQVKELRSGDVFDLAGLSITAIHAPGHTRGSLMFRILHTSSATEVIATGDVLFAGTIGRTDLPTGSAPQMAQTLREKVLTLPDMLRVLPGHGPETTIARERSNNPYLREASLRDLAR